MIKKFLVGHFLKWVWQIWFVDSKIDYISRTNWFFAWRYIFTQIKKQLEIFGVSMVKDWVWRIWWQKSKIDCIWRMNRWNKLFFCMLIRIQKKLIVDSMIFWVGIVKNCHDLWVHETLKFVVSQELIYELNWFFECW